MVCDPKGSIFTKYKHKVFIFIFSNLLVLNALTFLGYLSSCTTTLKKEYVECLLSPSLIVIDGCNSSCLKKEYIVFKNSWYTNGLFIVLNAKVRELFYLDLVTYSWSFLRTIVYHEWRLLNLVLCSKNLNEVISFYE